MAATVHWISLFEIQEIPHNACYLYLPSTLKIYPVVNIVFLKPASAVVPMDPKRVVLVNPHDMTDKEWKVESIVTHKYQGK